MYGIHPSVALEFASSGTYLDRRVRKSPWNLWGRIASNRTRKRFYWINPAGTKLKWASKKKKQHEACVPISGMRSIGFGQRRKSFVVHLKENVKIELCARTTAHMKLWVTALGSSSFYQKPLVVYEDSWRDFENWVNELDETLINKLLYEECSGTRGRTNNALWRNTTEMLRNALQGRRSTLASVSSTNSRQIGRYAACRYVSRIMTMGPADEKVKDAEQHDYAFRREAGADGIILSYDESRKELHPIVASLQPSSLRESKSRAIVHGQVSPLCFAQIIRATTPQTIVALFLSLVDCPTKNSDGAPVRFYEGQHAMCVLFCGRCVDESCCLPHGNQCAACREVQIQGESKLLPVEQYSQLQEIPLDEVRRHLADFSDSAQESMSLETFSILMQSQKNSITNLHLNDDMSRPLPEYFIATSHNTYLEGDQLTGESTVKQYTDVLTRRVCRCIEIDLWDGSKGPIVTHGHTMCGKIAFEEVIQAVHKFGFTSSPYPVVISIEQHCSPNNIALQGRIMAEVLGSTLVLFDETMQQCVSLMAPKELKYKVLVKAKIQKIDVFDRCITLRGSKHTPADLQKTLATVQEDESGSSWSRRPYNIASYSEKKMVSFMKKAFACEPESALAIPAKEKQSYMRTVRKWVSDRFKSSCGKGLCYLRASKRFGLSGQQQHDKKHDEQREKLSAQKIELQKSRSSVKFSPKKLRKKRLSCSFMAQQDAFKNNEVCLLRKYHMHFLSRIYPKGTRVRSTNFHPWLPWHVGCQMAAMNYQTLDEPMILSEGLFRNTNARAGYVLKEVVNDDKQCTGLFVKIICGSFLYPYCQRPLFVRCSLSMDPRHNCSFATDVISHEMNPAWNYSHIFDINPRWWGESHHILTFEVFSHQSVLSTSIRVLYNAVPLRFLSCGTFRWVELYDEDAVRISRSGLFVNVYPVK